MSSTTHGCEICLPSQICPAGTFSTEGQASCTPCPAGRYCESPGQKSHGEECPEGHFCLSQTIKPQPCRPGTYQPSKGATKCMPCPLGFYCSEYRATKATGECNAGTICVEGATRPIIMDHVYSFDAKKNGLCPAGHFCDKGANAPTPCPEGQYQVQFHQF